MNFYRYESVEYAVLDYDGDYVSSPIPNPKLELRTYELKKETNKGYWIGFNGFSSYKKWIPKISKKRYAYPTKEEAIINYIKRTEKRIKILQRQIYCSEITLRYAIDLNNYFNKNINI
jgi:hypothetical protein